MVQEQASRCNCGAARRGERCLGYLSRRHRDARKLRLQLEQLLVASGGLVYVLPTMPWGSMRDSLVLELRAPTERESLVALDA